jgi:aspartyl-tRNA(Asn)/glutamyl-tRNA(Gln) amidotransferase subunit A
MEGIWLARPPVPAAGDRRLAVKDLFDTAGLETTYGSALFRGHVPDRSAEAVVRLERAGYEIAGKTNLHEFAWGITSENPHFGPVPNPLHPGRSPGGSSGGSAAALVAGEADAALGTDTGGSIRIPAACCAVTGFKPTHGLVSTEGCFPLAPSFDHAGPMAREVAGCAAMMRALAPELAEPPDVTLADLRLGILWLDDADADVREGAHRAVARLPGAEPVALDRADARDTYPLFFWEVAQIHRERFASRREAYGPDLAVKLDGAMKVSAEAAEQARHARERFREAAVDAIDGFDLLLSPTIPCVPPPLTGDDLATRSLMTRFTFPVNALGWPALALPCATTAGGLPVSVQLIGRPGADALVLGAGAALEAALR